jgi:hypothetical protein
MSTENKATTLRDEPGRHQSYISDGRRRLLKGGLLGAPILLTLPKVTFAATSNIQLVPKDFGIDETEGVNPPQGFAYVSRTAYTITRKISNLPPITLTKHIVNGDFRYPSASQCNYNPGPIIGPEYYTWHEIGNWSATFVVQTSCTNPDGLTIPSTVKDIDGNTWNVTADAGPVNLLVGVDSTGTPISYGPTTTATNIISQSSWTSINPNQSIGPDGQLPV